MYPKYIIRVIANCLFLWQTLAHVQFRRKSQDESKMSQAQRKLKKSLMNLVYAFEVLPNFIADEK